jgi:glycosyltransferase involved in cell wall biosynthesis
VNEQFDISIVLSSYNRENKVRQTIESIFKSDLSIFKAVELIIVDDGSPFPVVDSMPPQSEIPPNLTIHLIRQENSGIGATRNLGFREAKSKLVLFLDDDIILEPDTIKKMHEAAAEHPGAVIFGNYPFISHQSESLHKFASLLFDYGEITSEKSYDQVETITSGLLCVNKERLGNPEKFYRDDMTIPAAEEHEIIARFHKMGIPVFRAKHIVATHNHPLELRWLNGQQYKYGMATAEAFIKNPEILQLKKFADLKQSLSPGGFKKWALNLLSSSAGRSLFTAYAKLLQKLSPVRSHNRVFGLLTTSYFFAGYREGVKKFKDKRGKNSDAYSEVPAPGLQQPFSN